MGDILNKSATTKYAMSAQNAPAGRIGELREEANQAFKTDESQLNAKAGQLQGESEQAIKTDESQLMQKDQEIVSQLQQLSNLPPEQTLILGQKILQCASAPRQLENSLSATCTCVRGRSVCLTPGPRCCYSSGEYRRVGVLVRSRVGLGCVIACFATLAIENALPSVTSQRRP